MHASVNIWPLNEQGASSSNRTAVELADHLRVQPGFVGYALVRTGEREVVAVTIFQTPEQLSAAARSVADLVEQRVRPLAGGEPARREGEVIYFTTGEPLTGDA